MLPAPSAEAFEAFFNHEIRLRWDTLLRATHVEGGGTHPYAGAISTNRGRGWKSGMTMRTRFLVLHLRGPAAPAMARGFVRLGRQHPLCLGDAPQIPGDGGFLANGKVNCQAPRDILA